MERRALQYFLAVADHGTFTYAAAALNVAQPSLSQAIQGLERELGVKLFHRVKHGARLTSAGEALVAPARRTLRDFEEAQAAVQNVKGLQSGRLVVVAKPHLAADPLPRLLGPFHQRYPDVAIRIINPDDHDILGMLRSGTADVGLDFSVPAGDGFNVARLPDEEVFIVLPPGTDGFGPVVSVSDLDDVDLIAPITPEHGTVRQWIREGGITSRILVETVHRVATVPLVLAGLGAALLTRQLARQAVALGAVAYRVDPPMHRQAYLIDVGPTTSAAAGAFLEIASEIEASPDSDSTAFLSGVGF
jgi:LysR family transcriptional regulator, carnitine catabolism transcriptional activator